jgi:hypothetical protein
VYGREQQTDIPHQYILGFMVALLYIEEWKTAQAPQYNLGLMVPLLSMKNSALIEQDSKYDLGLIVP